MAINIIGWKWTFFDISGVRTPFTSTVNQFLWDGNHNVKKKKNIEDLDQEIDVFHTQNEEEREKALLELIAKIIIESTLKEYYALPSNIE